MNYNIALLKGDGIGPEIVESAVRVLEAVGKKYGHIARMTLSYDFTFLAVMMLALDQTDPQYKRKGCVYNPFKKCVYITDKDDIFDLVSAAAVSSVYAKIVDNIEDSKGLKKFGYRIFKAIFSRKYEKRGNSKFREKCRKRRNAKYLEIN